MGIVHHASYLAWMEVGRVELCRARGVRYRDMERDDGIMLAVVEANCRYLASARFDDELVVRTWIVHAHPRMVRFGYEMRNAETGQLVTTGETKHIFVNREMRPTKLPAKYFELFGIGAAVEK